MGGIVFEKITFNSNFGSLSTKKSIKDTNFHQFDRLQLKSASYEGQGWEGWSFRNDEKSSCESLIKFFN